MCGLIGIASRKGSAGRDWLPRGRDAMRHRGPDGDGEWWSPDGRVGLAHRRLSILDLTVDGRQPMCDADGGLCISFNGEIYNYRELKDELSAKGARFRSHSDTEVILAAYREWGTGAVTRLNGMFAFALYDMREESLFLARDRAGEKPLFYSLDGDAIRFASELKGLLADPAQTRRIDPESLDCYLAGGYVPGSRCILHGIRKLPPAHALLFDLKNGQDRVWRYWGLPVPDITVVAAGAGSGGGEARSEADLLDELERLLEDSVCRQLVADVPVGVLLSGGVDSSLVTAMAARAIPRVRTFTIRFPGQAKFDETKHARLIASYFGTDHNELEADGATVDLLPILARQFDEPIIDSSMLPTYLVSNMIRKHCTVALGGDGGDELFGGYSHYNRLLWLQARFGKVPSVVRAAVAAGAGLLPIGFQGRNWLQALGMDLDSGVPLIAGYFDRRTRSRLLGAHAGTIGAAERILDSRSPAAGDLLQRAMRMDFENYLPEDILVKVDRASMLNSLEIRAPLLDYRLIEFAFAKVPSRLKATATSRKVLLKRLTERVLPPEFDRKRKQGFSIPLNAWLRSGPWLEYFKQVLFDGSQTLFDKRLIQGLFDGLANGRFNGERLFGLLMFELWRREYKVEM
ncbi:MAG: asparagine synthase (glutamine-hydrolyzing) [Fibrobacteria bacterium]